LNQLVFETIEDSELSKTELAEKLNISVQSFAYKYKQGILDWEEIKALELPLTRAAFKKALKKDFEGTL
jgi:ribosome-binding protein aMBF1 (putative translation factor)